MTYITLLGRIPAISLAELERTFGSKAVSPFSTETATVESETFDIQRFGGIIKAGTIALELQSNAWSEVSKKIVQHYTDKWSTQSGKQTLGISVYGWTVSPRDIQKTGLILKSKLKSHGRSLRLIPNISPALNTATSHHNKLGLSDNKTELLVVRGNNGKVIVAESIGAQNISALAARDQERPKRDTFVGMLPPKLALTMVNLAVGEGLDNNLPSADLTRLERQRTAREADVTITQTRLTVLDPFCGTGVILQEAALLGHDTYGTDLSDKMIDYSRQNMEWLIDKYHLRTKFTTLQGDAMDTSWQAPIDAVACETYLGQPFSAPPRPEKLKEVRNLCNHIVSSFLDNISTQLKPGTPLCLAVPAWRDDRGNLTHLPIAQNIATIEKLGFTTIKLSHVRNEDLIYYREDQVVARQLLLLEKV